MNLINKLNKYFISLLMLIIVTACGGGAGGKSATGNTDSSSGSGLSGINGTITVRDHATWDKGTMSLTISKGVVTDSYNIIGDKLGDRPNSTRHPSGKIVYREKCNHSDSMSPVRISMYDEGKDIKKAIIPCSNEVQVPIRITNYEIAKLSPDELKVAVTVSHISTELGVYYSVLVFDVRSQKILANHRGYKDFEWLPNGRLLLLPFTSDLGYGIFVTNTNLQAPMRIEAIINQTISQPDIDPSGKRLLFIKNKQIYLMNMDGTGLKQLIKSRYALFAPTWSPDGKYFSYLDGIKSFAEDYDKIIVYELSTKDTFEVSLDNWLSEKYSSQATWPMSWTK